MIGNKLVNGVLQGKGYKIYAAKILEDFGHDVTGGKLKSAKLVVSDAISDKNLKIASEAHSSMGKALLVNTKKAVKHSSDVVDDGTIFIKKRPTKAEYEAKKAHSKAISLAKEEYSTAKKIEDSKINSSLEHKEKQKMYNRLFHGQIHVG